MINETTGKNIISCPFCGGDHGVVVNSGHSGCDDHFAVECNRCGACGPDAAYPDTKDQNSKEWMVARVEAIKLWNKRA